MFLLSWDFWDLLRFIKIYIRVSSIFLRILKLAFPKRGCIVNLQMTRYGCMDLKTCFQLFITSSKNTANQLVFFQSLSKSPTFMNQNIELIIELIRLKTFVGVMQISPQGLQDLWSGTLVVLTIAMIFEISRYSFETKIACYLISMESHRIPCQPPLVLDSPNPFLQLDITKCDVDIQMKRSYLHQHYKSNNNIPSR